MTTQTQNKTLVKQGKRELREWLQGDEFKAELAATLPRSMSPERFVRIAFQATYRNPDLLKCSQESFFNCLLQLSAMGLEPDGRRAHLIPFGDQCTLVVDYKGIKELVRRNKDVSAMHGDVVGENDEFEVRFGTRGILDHKPNLHDRGRIYCAYSWVKLPNGDEEYDVMNLAEIEAIRKRSRSPNKGPWVTDWNEMAKKTVFRRHSKGLPLSPETRDALDRDQDADALTDQERFGAAAPARASVLRDTHSRVPGRTRLPTGIEDDRTDGNEAPEKPAKVPESATMAQSAEPGNTLAESPSAPPQAAAAGSLARQVTKLLGESGYSEAELLRLLKPLRLAPKEATSLDDVSDTHLQHVLDDWQTCKDRLDQERKVALEP